ncbi:hypothetical protein KIW84_053469 [Lathyrus oleraceus]|uniref:Uncharacterized protein n=1 Tax=Pisum sativum TaxID=3888 RepID=A0A9D5ADC0_PEA|nr:hypothetical protein KIW84_053469 [Pisum sativum]
MKNQQHVMVLYELEVDALEFVSDTSDLDAGGILIETVKILQIEDSQKSGLISLDADINILDTLSNMLTKSQVLKEVDGHVNIINDEDVRISMTVHHVDQMLTELEEDIMREVSYLPECQAKQIKEYSSDPQERSCSEPLLKVVIKFDEEDIVQEVPNITRNMIVAECSTQRKVEQAAEANTLVSYLPECQAKQIKEYSSDPQERSCSEPLLKVVIKFDEEDIIQEVPDITRNMMVAECFTQRKVEQAAEANALVIMFNI